MVHKGQRDVFCPWVKCFTLGHPEIKVCTTSLMQLGEEKNNTAAKGLSCNLMKAVHLAETPEKKPPPSSACEYAHSTIHLARPKDIISGIWREKSIHNKHPQELLCLQLGPMDIQTEYLKAGVNHSTRCTYCVSSPWLVKV